jgi:hypothetical protein
MFEGGLVISFTSPLIIMEFYLHYKSEYFIFFALILGAISMIAGCCPDDRYGKKEYTISKNT